MGDANVVLVLGEGFVFVFGLFVFSVTTLYTVYGPPMDGHTQLQARGHLCDHIKFQPLKPSVFECACEATARGIFGSF